MNRKLIAAGSLLTLALAGCAAPPVPAAPATTEPATAPQDQVVACLVADPANGVANDELKAGLEKAGTELTGIKTQVTEVGSGADYAGVLQAQVDDGCTVVVATGADSADPMLAAAKANSQTQFALIDVTPNSVPNNLRPVLFHTQDAAFLAGYAAAASSTSGVVGTFGALNVPAVTIYMDGFVQGVEKYNEAKGAAVQVNGWTRDSRSGTFVASPTDPWNDPDAGAATAATLGADVVLAVAGKSGEGALNAAAQGGSKVVWAENDGCSTYADRCDQILGSVIKDRGAALFQLLTTVVENRGASGVFVANLKNGGVDLVGVKDEALASEIAGLKQDIIDGKIDVKSDSAIG